MTVCIGLDAHDDIWQGAIGAVGEGVLVVDLVDGVGGNASRTDNLGQSSDDLVERKHRQTIDNGEWIIENLESGRFQFSIIHYQFSKLQMTAAGNQDMAPG